MYSTPWAFIVSLLEILEPYQGHYSLCLMLFNPIALRKAKIAYNFGLSECNRVKSPGGFGCDTLYCKSAYDDSVGCIALDRVRFDDFRCNISPLNQILWPVMKKRGLQYLF